MTGRSAGRGGVALTRERRVRLTGAAIGAAWVLFTVLPAWAAGQGEKWELVGFTKYRDAVFVDRNRISPAANQGSQVWSKIAPSAKSRYYRQIRQDLKRAGKAYWEFSYIETLNEVDCRDARIRYWKVIYFGRDGLVLHDTRDESPPWKPVHPGSLWDAVKRAACGK